MSITLSSLRSRLNNTLNDPNSTIWSATVKDQAINAGIARLYPFNFLEKTDTTQTTDTDAPTFLYTTPSDCENLCQVFIANVATDPKIAVVPWTWYGATSQVELRYIEKYYDAKTITMLYEAAHPQLATDNATLDPQTKEDVAIEAVLYWAKLQCWEVKDRQNIGKIELADYLNLQKWYYGQFGELLRRCTMPRIPIINF